MQSAPDFRIVCVAPEMLGEMWPHVGPLLLRCELEITRGDMHKALLDLLEQVKLVHLHRSQVWAVIDDNAKEVVAALTTEIKQEAPGQLVVWVSRMAGKRLIRWGRMLRDRMIEFARAEGAIAVRFDGRAGLRRAYGRDIKVIGERPTASKGGMQSELFTPPKGSGVYIFEKDLRS